MRACSFNFNLRFNSQLGTKLTWLGSAQVLFVTNTVGDVLTLHQNVSFLLPDIWLEIVLTLKISSGVTLLYTPLGQCLNAMVPPHKC